MTYAEVKPVIDEVNNVKTQQIHFFICFVVRRTMEQSV